MRSRCGDSRPACHPTIDFVTASPEIARLAADCAEAWKSVFPRSARQFVTVNGPMCTWPGPNAL